ncbi:TPA: hypothetical protein DEP34_03740 [Candidatus Uhrbacteria bacterium]|nr:hypothetical protein [Candidatus Uhrbacteria bacterium]HCB19468.1 hypothetical protein [Candidatus Uhrbacteria bacterium]
MSPFFRILLGLIVMMIGFLFVAKTHVLISWFGASDFAEEKMGPGSSSIFYKICGVIIAFIGVFIATDIISDLMRGFADIFV